LHGACVNGVVYYGLIQEDIQILTAFENVEYVPTVVTVEAD
jgi:hypothetical protein